MSGSSDDLSLSSVVEKENGHPTNPHAPASESTSSLHEPVNNHDADNNEKNRMLKFGFVLSLFFVAVTIRLLPLYTHNDSISFARDRRHHGGESNQQKKHHIKSVTDSTKSSGSSSVASLAYKTAPFDLPYTKIDCQPCPTVSKLMNPLAPFAVIGGTMKGGTRALLKYLQQHPDVYSHQGSEMHLLDNQIIKIFDSFDDPVCDQCKVLETYNGNYNQRRKNQTKGEADRDLIFFDKSPKYLTFSHIVPQRMVCTFPQTAKIIFLLRNPVDRTYSHYHHWLRKPFHGNISFEEYVDADYNSLLAAGVLNASSPIDEYETFVRYLHSKNNLILAKSLYAITLRSWIAVFRDHFGDEKIFEHMMIVESERLREHTQEVFYEILEFLGMPPCQLESAEEFHKSPIYEPMSDNMRQRLEIFFRPQNARLHEMLSPFGVELSWAKEDATLVN